MKKDEEKTTEINKETQRETKRRKLLLLKFYVRINLGKIEEIWRNIVRNVRE